MGGRRANGSRRVSLGGGLFAGTSPLEEHDACSVGERVAADREPFELLPDGFISSPVASRNRFEQVAQLFLARSTVAEIAIDRCRQVLERLIE